MKALDAIVTREAKEQAGFFALALLLGPLLIYAGQLSLAHYSVEWPGVALMVSIPGTTALLWWALILDAAVRDSDSTVGASLERLPVSSLMLLCGKVLWLACAGIVLFSWIRLAEGVISFLGGGAPASFTGSRYSSLWHAWGSAAMVGGAYCLAMGLWLRRPFLVVSVSVLSTLGELAAWREFAQPMREIPKIMPLGWLAALMAFGTLCAAWVVLRPGHLLPREGLLRTSGFLVIVGGLSTGVTWAHLGGWKERALPRFGVDRAARIKVSSDGQWLAVHARRDYEGVFGSMGIGFKGWVLDKDSGSLAFEFPSSYFSNLVNWESINDSGLPEIQPEQSKLRATRTSEGYKVLLPGETEPFFWEFRHYAEFSRVPGRAFSVAVDGAVERHEFLEGKRTEIYRLRVPRALGGPGLTESPDGRFLHVFSRSNAGSVYLDAKIGLVLGTLPAGWVHRGWTGATDPIAYARAAEDRADANLLFGPDGFCEASGPYFDELHASGDNTFFACGNGSVWSVDPKGKLLRHLYSPGGEKE